MGALIGGKPLVAWWALVTALGLGAVSLVVGIAIWPHDQGPILGMFIIAPLGFALGAIIGTCIGLLRYRSVVMLDQHERQMPVFGSLPKVLVGSVLFIALVLLLGPIAMRIWDTVTGQDIMTLRGHSGFINCVTYSPDGKYIASGDSQGVKVWESTTGRQKLNLVGHTALVNSLAFTADGEWIVTGSYDRTIKIWNATTGHLGPTLRGHKGSVYSVACSPDGKWIVSSGAGSDSQGQPVPNELLIWDARTGKQTGSFTGHTKPVTCVAFSPDSRWIVSSSYDGTLRVWEVAKGKNIMTFNGRAGVNSVSFSRDGKRIVSGGAAIQNQGVHAMGEVTLWDSATSQQVWTITGHNHVVESVAYSPDGKWIVSGSDDRSLKIWDAESGQETKTFRGHGDMVTSVAFSPDGKRIVSASRDFTIRIWNVALGEGP
jgi:WD40 repeat protein